ncbi:MAG: cache domain-containing protein [Methanoregula sp.]|nr:cache domain-containing protein [Methanoregula sp.]
MRNDDSSMKKSILVLFLLLIAGLVLVAGCSQTTPQKSNDTTAMTTTPPSVPATGKITPADLTTMVKEAVTYARENGREKAVAAFNDPNGSFVKNGVYVFAETYDGTALAEPFEQDTVGTNIRNMTDRYGVPLIRNLEETAGYGIGYVSYDYPDMADKRVIKPKLSVVADVDGTYYAGAGTYAGTGMVYPSTGIGPKSRAYTTTDLTGFVKNAVAYAKQNGKENVLVAFNDPKGQFADGELTLIAVDYNGTVLASSITPESANEHINLINYHDPDGVTTIREMRDLSLQGGGFSYTVAAVTTDNKTWYAPKIDYAEPVDDTYWIFSGIIVPDYEQLRQDNLMGITVRNHTRTEVYDLVDRAVTYAKANGKEKALAEIGNPGGQFVNGDLFVWAEDFNGTVLADPFWKEGVGKNWLNYTDPYGAKTTVVSINAIKSGTGFTHTMFPETAEGRTAFVPKLVYMKAVDDTWWIGSGIYGVQKA